LNKKAAMLILLLCLSCFSTALVNAQLLSPAAPSIYPVSFPNFDMYAPAEIVVTYTYTQSYQVTVSDFGQTLHQEISTPTSMTFNTTADDVYNITFTVNYDVYVNQTVTVSLFETGLGVAKTMELGMDSKGFIINMIVSTSTPPTFPNANQIAEQISALFTNQVNVMQSSNNNVINSIMTAVVFACALSAIAIGVTVGALLLFMRGAVKKAKIDSLLHPQKDGGGG